MDDAGDTRPSGDTLSESYWVWMDRGAGVFGLVVTLMGGVLLGGTGGYTLGALFGAVFNVDVVVYFAAAGAVPGAAEGIRVWRFARRLGGREDPSSRSR